ncbi:hypothetical protein Pcac1_g10420 [Phytophthora cactorum]|nr:hypothetical protein Pcac1_g10420 [Phytophthora cactorum]
MLTLEIFRRVQVSESDDEQTPVTATGMIRRTSDSVGVSPTMVVVGVRILALRQALQLVPAQVSLLYLHLALEVAIVRLVEFLV